MSKPNQLAKQNNGTREAWGDTFQWTADHQTPEQYNHLKYTCDTLAEDCLTILHELSRSQDLNRNGQEQEKDAKDSTGHQESELPLPRPKDDLYLLLRDHHQENETLQQLWDQVNTVPEWVDWDQIERGQKVFYRYGAATITGLTYQSLLGGMAGSRVAEVLARTGGFNIKNLRRRLLETTQFNIQCTTDLASIKPGGDGFASCLRVRLLHATVRRRILQITSLHPSYYSVEENGLPINDLDCIGTIAVFSATIIWQSLPRQGIFLRPQEVHDYLALWRLVAHYMGTPTECFSTPAKAKAIMESLYLYEYTPSPTSRLHAGNIIQALENTAPVYASRSYLTANARWLNGDQLADALGLDRPGLYYRALTAGQCITYMAICYTCRAIPALDRMQINAFRRRFWSVVESPEWGLGGLTSFKFTYVPEYGRRTRDPQEAAPAPERANEKAKMVFWTADRKSLLTLVFVVVVSLLGLLAVGKVTSLAGHLIYSKLRGSRGVEYAFWPGGKKFAFIH